MYTKIKSEEKFWDEAAKRLQAEEGDLNAMLATAESFSSEKLIDDWQEHNSPIYEEALRHRLAQIRDALLRLCQQSYGRCIDCGIQLDKKRLMIDPAIARCFACQNMIKNRSLLPH